MALIISLVKAIGDHEQENTQNRSSYISVRGLFEAVNSFR